MRVMMLAYSALLAVGLVLSAPWWLLRMATTERYSEGLGQRLGLVPAGLRAAVAGKRIVWIHAVSVGEVLAASRLVVELEAALGMGWAVVVSTTTRTGQALARKRFGAERVFYVPLDFAFAVRAYLRVLRPAALVLMESEVWPRMLHECALAGVPVAVVNARVSDRSFARGMKMRGVWARVLRMPTLWMAQSEEDARRLVAMGAWAEAVRVGGNLKYDVRAPKESRVAELVHSFANGRKVIVAGSTCASLIGKTEFNVEYSEEQLVVNSWVKALRFWDHTLLVIAPRHPERFVEVEKIAQSYVSAGVRRLLESPPNLEAGAIEVVLLDTIGDLAAVYGLADVAFVGGSLVKRGGHNPLEPAQFGVPVVMGPSFENFRDVVEKMQGADGIKIVEDADGLEAALVELLTDRVAAKAMGERGRRVFEEQQGATGRAVEAIVATIQGGVGLSARRGWAWPLVPLYAAALRVKEAMRGEPKRLRWPVVSVGSLSAGGAGKTPVVIALAGLLKDAGWGVDVLSRGYGRDGGGVELVAVTDEDHAKRFGDEPVLIAERARVPVFVGASRFAAGFLAEQRMDARFASGKQVLRSAQNDKQKSKDRDSEYSANRLHLLDDGFQHQQLARDVDVVLVTAEDLEDSVIPAGNLREPLAALGRADVVIVREDEVETVAKRVWPLVREGAQMWVVRRRLRFPAPLFVFGAGLRPVAFCGLSRPEGFASMLMDAGCGIVETVAFQDHHRYNIADMARVVEVARGLNATGFVTTEKDAVKLSGAMRARLERVGPLMVVALEAEFDDPAAVVRALELRLLAGAGGAA